MIKNIFQGRTGNLMLQNIGLSILSKKFDMKAEYCPMNELDVLGVRLEQRTRVITEKFEKVYDTDLMNVLDRASLESGISYDGNFQVKDFVLNYRKDIKDHFQLNYTSRNIDKNDVFIHVRLGDVPHSTPGLEYYRRAIKSISYRKGYISSDSRNHEIVLSLIKEFNLEFFDASPIKLIDFAKDFNQLILSKGTFSWWMGFLCKGENIIYPIGDIPWYGNIFVFDDWKSIDIRSSS